MPVLSPLVASTWPDNMHFCGLLGLVLCILWCEQFELVHYKKEKKVLLYIKMVFCATVHIADVLYSLESSVVVKDVKMCVYNIDTVYAYHLLFWGPCMIMP